MTLVIELIQLHGNEVNAQRGMNWKRARAFANALVYILWQNDTRVHTFRDSLFVMRFAVVVFFAYSPPSLARIVFKRNASAVKVQWWRRRRDVKHSNWRYADLCRQQQQQQLESFDRSAIYVLQNRLLRFTSTGDAFFLIAFNLLTILIWIKIRLCSSTQTNSKSNRWKWLDRWECYLKILTSSCRKERSDNGRRHVGNRMRSITLTLCQMVVIKRWASGNMELRSIRRIHA